VSSSLILPDSGFRRNAEFSLVQYFPGTNLGEANAEPEEATNWH
jgi:hypothetical protein